MGRKQTVAASAFGPEGQEVPLHDDDGETCL